MHIAAAVIVFGAVVTVVVVISERKIALRPVVTTPEVVPLGVSRIIGKSVEGRNIEAYTYGNGGTHLLFVGGIHGGYEWNSVLLAYRFMDYLKVNPTAVSKNVTIAVIPNANPDGVYRVVKKEGTFEIGDVPSDKKLLESGRLNANKVDLNRNFDCKWQPTGTWRSKTVSAGTKAFSEPEASALKYFVREYAPEGVVFWHSKANAVYGSNCEGGTLPKTIDIMNAYAKAAGYKAIKSFNDYPVSGDAEGWLASIGIPAITVELKSHETVEWEENLAGITALLGYYEGVGK